MAGIQGANQLFDLLRALKRRRYQVMVPALLVSSLGIALAVMVPKRFKVTTRIEIMDSARVGSKNPQDVSSRREVYSVSDHIRNFARVKGVIEGNLAQWPEYVKAPTPELRGDFINQEILKQLAAGPTAKDLKSGSIFVDVSFSDEDRNRASKFLQDLTESWLTEMREIDRGMLITERAKLQEIVDVQAKDLTYKEDRLYGQIELLGRDPNDPDKRDDRGDWTFKELEKAKTLLADVEFDLDTAEFKLEQASERLAAEPPTLSRRISVEADDPESELAKLEATREAIQDRLANLRPNNSTYKRLKPKLVELVREIEELRRREPAVSERWEEEENERVAEYEEAVRTFEDEVGRLRDQRESLLARVRGLEEESKARTQQYRRLDDLRNQVGEARLLVNETRRQWEESNKSLLMLDAAPTPWKISQPPTPSSATTKPNPYLLSAIAVVLGLALGVGLAVLSEFARNCYRSVGDLASVMTVPVLGAIDTILTRRERRRIQFSHAVAGLSTAVIVGTIGWVTWLWYSSPERLPLEVQEAIERMRMALKM